MLRRIEACAIVMIGALSAVGVAQKVVVQNAIAASSNSNQDTNQSLQMASWSPRDAGISAPYSSSAIMVVPQTPVKKAKREYRVGPFSTVAVSIEATSLGAGVELATPLSRTLNLRGGTSFFNMGYGFGDDGANYDFNLHLRTGRASIDWFPFHGGFHISPGVLIYKSQLSGTANVASGNSFELGNSTYTSSATDPVHGNASLSFSRTLMPALTFGWGNLIPRSGRHVSIPFEIGAAYMGHNAVHLALQGTSCMQAGCLSTSDPTVQQNVLNEQNNLNESIKRLQAYPIISTGFSYRF
jgi:hypothetical protein